MALTLVIGGARSGKSAFAESLAMSAERMPVYIATATPGDAEMQARIATHRRRRGERWRTVEEPLALTTRLAEWARPECVVLIDCLTLWLSNLIQRIEKAHRVCGDHLATATLEEALESETRQLFDALIAAPGPIVLVSNEVGLGIVPSFALGRAFRDEHGKLNRRLADICQNVIFVAAGQPLLLKPQPDWNIEI